MSTMGTRGFGGGAWRAMVGTSLVAAAMLAGAMPAGGVAQQPARKQLLALGDTHTGFTHESISHALAVVDAMGRESGLWDTHIRTDSQWITKQPIPAPARNARTLDDFDAVFLFVSGEGNLTDQQKRDFVSFVHDDGKGVVAAQRGVLRLAGVRRDDWRLLRQPSVERR